MKNIYYFIKNYALLGLLIAVLLVFFHWDLYRYISVESLRLYQDSAIWWTETHYLATVSVYILLYIVMIACAIPCATLLTLIGGFLFGVSAFWYAIFSTTVGGVILFLAIRSAIGSRLAAKSTGWVKRLEKGFKRNAFNYILMLRLVPILPCWVSNITAGVLNVRLLTFITATVLGIIPATLIYVLVGRGLDKILANETMPLSQIVLSPEVFFPLLALAILSLIPIIYKTVKK